MNAPSRLGKAPWSQGNIKGEFSGAHTGGKRTSLADLIVLGGCAGVKQAAWKAGPHRRVPGLDWHRVFRCPSPAACEFRNCLQDGRRKPLGLQLLELAFLLAVSPPKMMVLIGGIRVLNANICQSQHGVFTHRLGVLHNDFFMFHLDIDTQWQAFDAAEGLFEERGRRICDLQWTGTRVDLALRADQELRTLSEAYVCEDIERALVRDFLA